MPSWTARLSALVEPRGVADAAELKSARTVATLTLGLSVLGALSIPIELALIPDYGPRAVVVGVAVAMLAGGFMLARAGRWRLAGALAAAVPPLGASAVLLVAPGDEVAPVGMLFGVLLASVFLRPRQAALFAVLICGWLGVLLTLLHHSREGAVAHVTFCAVFSTLLVWAGAWRESVAEVSRAALQGDERQRAEAQRLEALGRLAGGVAHDFNNLLQVVSMSSALAMDRLPAKDRHLLAQMDLAVEQGKALISTLLAFARKTPVEPQRVELRLAIEEVVAMVRRLVGREVFIEVQLDGSPAVFASPMQIRQVVMNLVLNAGDAMPKGGRVTVSAGAASNEVWLSVADTGTGIAPELVDRVFEPFFSTKQRGTGIGLATVKDIVTRAGGRLDLQTALGVGTTFTARFPQPPPEGPVTACLRRTPGPGP